MASKILSLTINDPTLVRKNVTELLQLLEERKLCGIVIGWRTKDNLIHNFKTGDDAHVNLVLDVMKADLLQDWNNGTIVTHEADKSIEDY